MTTFHLNKYADVLIWGLETARASFDGKYKKGDIIYISYDLDGLKLVEVLSRKLLEKGLHVQTKMLGTPKMEFDFCDLANNDQLKFLPPWSKKLYSHLSGSIVISAPASLTHLAGVDPKKFTLPSLARKPLRDIMDKNEEKGKFGWTLCVMPTLALAKQAKMPLSEYSREIEKACYLDKPNPVEIWENLRKKSAFIKKWLDNLDVDYFHIESKNINLKIKYGEKRQWLGISGHNIPSFEIFTSPDWRGAEGIYYSNMPSFANGNYIQGVKLWFKNGRVVKIKAQKGENLVKKRLAMDRGAGQIGEISFTDKRFSRITKFMANGLYDENVGGKYGNCHLAVGHSFSDAYAGNRKKLTKKIKERLGFNDSALHWDLINTENKKVTAYLKSGKKVVIYKNGMFTP
ncbi:aminopeptidase [Candidatus Wolfebacteria bacterium]|nr:aminopeptidase [Candidatus Wolfebacteria bacterium]